MIDRRGLLLSGGAVALTGNAPGRRSAVKGAIHADWESFAAAYQVPEWFRDAKFGIWAHWGPQAARVR